MKFSEQWLREWVNPAVDTATLAEQLTMAGLEVDSIEPAAPAFENIVVGEVISMRPHPEADRLNICEVNVAQTEHLTIVCGANNVAQGVKIPTAIVGAVLPGDFKIKKAKLRGVESFGMLCSEKEIGISDSADGLMILPDDATVGENIRDYLSLDDQIIEVDFTPNRGDCLSVTGISREIGVLNNAEVTPVVTSPVTPEIDDSFTVDVQAPADCPRYLGRVIKGIDANAKTPLWMQERLRRAGLRSLSPTVDVTNYVLLEFGQPMHAFDLNKLNNKIVVRRAKKNEKITLLDESKVTLNENILVIADSKTAVAFAGVMGGLDSAVTNNTQDIFLECAYFQPDSIRGKARQFGIQTDSSYRFERGVDFNLQQRAMERATKLIIEIAGGKAGPINEQVDEASFPKRENIAFRRSRLTRVLGFSVEDNVVENILTRLGMTWSHTKEGWLVVAPDYRFDISIEVDLIEEIGRVYGYNNLPTHSSLSELRFVEEPEANLTKNRIRNALVDLGYQEAITYSFVDKKIQAMLDPENDPIELANPISAEMSVMRTTLWSSLLKTAEYNQARQQSRLRLFETGKRFIKSADKTIQETVVAGLVSGDVLPTQWGVEQRKADFFDVKNDVEHLFKLTGNHGKFTFISGKHPALHPGQSAQILFENRAIGWLGTLHPSIKNKMGLNLPVILFELSYTDLEIGVVPQYTPVSKFPSIKRDLALVVTEDVTAGKVFAEINKSGDNRLQLVEIFDIYNGRGMAEGTKSLAVSLTIQDDEKTLIDDEVDEIIQKILVSLQDSIGATLRE